MSNRGAKRMYPRQRIRTWEITLCLIVRIGVASRFVLLIDGIIRHIKSVDEIDIADLLPTSKMLVSTEAILDCI